ncbi:hypothetical protein BCV70DRAFT_126011 [Testicularia cyperi]|uniref:Uncharacterized protein n=1 Tax=Testicularia cyperi TaxID=1882483 RepID=A0A317XPH3_9BASI|nr:hypothetical protein BCV70DRAFT_126011 [Testicularia cyperi]
MSMWMLDVGWKCWGFADDWTGLPRLVGGGVERSIGPWLRSQTPLFISVIRPNQTALREDEGERVTDPRLTSPHHTAVGISACSHTQQQRQRASEQGIFSAHTQSRASGATYAPVRHYSAHLWQTDPPPLRHHNAKIPPAKLADLSHSPPFASAPASPSGSGSAFEGIVSRKMKGKPLQHFYFYFLQGEFRR